jgi:hypothetical protein
MCETSHGNDKTFKNETNVKKTLHVNYPHFATNGLNYHIMTNNKLQPNCTFLWLNTKKDQHNKL